MSTGIPQVLIQPLRVALQQQGFPPEMVRDDGSLNPAGFLATLYDEVEFRSSLWPNITAKTRGVLMDQQPNPFLSWAKPTVVLRKGDATTTIAPYGVSPGGTVIPAVGVALLLVGVGYVLAKL